MGKRAYDQKREKKDHSLKLVTLGLCFITYVIATNIKYYFGYSCWNIKKNLFLISSLFYLTQKLTLIKKNV